MGLSDAQQSWLESAVADANRASQATGLSSTYILSQAALESNYGQSGLAKNANNYFGIKGSGITMPTQEFINGQMQTVNAGFASYPNMSASFDAYSSYINKKGLQGYATDPNYQSKIGGVMNTVTNALGKGTSTLSSVGNTLKWVASNIYNAKASDAIDQVAGSVPIVGKIKSIVECGPICQLEKWFADTHFLERLAIVVLALILIASAFYLLKPASSSSLPIPLPV